MAEKLTLECFDLKLKRLKSEDYRKKIDIAANVGKYCSDTKKLDPSLTSVTSLTGVSRETLLAINLLEDKSYNFERWLTERNQIIHGYTYDYTTIRKLVIKCYTELHEIPKIKGNNKYKAYRKYFNLIQLPGYNFSMIVEKPETVMARQKFLYTKMQYQEQKKNIVYIGKINLLLSHGKFSFKEDNIESNSRFIVAASPTFGYMGYIYGCGNSTGYLSHWMEEKIISKLPQESVVIFQENVVVGCVDEEISSYTSKEDMINWMDVNNIQCDPKMHRADLFKLIEQNKEYCAAQLSDVESIFRARGHITLRKKKCNLNNNYFDPFWVFLSHELNKNTLTEAKNNIKNHTLAITSGVNTIVQNCPLEYWNNLGSILAEKERDIYREDLEVEYVIDQLMTMGKHEGLANEKDKHNFNLDEYSKSEASDYCVMSDQLRKTYLKMQNNYRTLNIYK